ncbi:MAG: hypothetical protein ISN28_04795 [Ectothiorhodospiraceae bacterium AqS1]|nr:hypothetical protein [Ectothiorhodospiraceae bacterium AqS1]
MNAKTMSAGAERSLGIGGDTDWIEHGNAPIQTAQPTGHGGVFGGPSAQWIEHNGTMVAESTHCTRDCDNDPLNGDNPILHQECLDECKENNRASADGKIMLAEGGCYTNDQGEEVCYGEDGTVVGSAPVNTMHASSIRLGDPQPVCGTDAWACFNGMDDESPLVRDVGIFGIFSQTARIYCKNGSTNCTSPGQNPK